MRRVSYGNNTTSSNNPNTRGASHCYSTLPFVGKCVVIGFAVTGAILCIALIIAALRI